MENSKYNIREICGDWALDIQWGKETIVLIFNSRNNAEFVKKILEWEDMHPNQAVPYVPVPQPGKPLTLDQLREMDGQPVWVKFIGHPDGTPIEPLWMLVNSREKRLVTDVEYVDWNSEGWLAYSYPPAHIDRSEWKPCGACKNDEITIHVPEFRAMAVCNQHMDREAFDLTLRLKFCSWCGRPLTEEAWAELERRVRG